MAKYKYLFITLASIAAIFCSDGHVNAGRDNFVQNRQPALNSNQKDTVHDDHLPNVTLSCSLPAFCEIEKKTIEARILQNETDKPDDIRPRHISFKFIGEYGEQSQSSMFTPEINIYSVSEYRKSLSVSTNYVTDFDEGFDSLLQLFTDQPLATNDDLPFIPFIDANKEFDVHIKYISFKNGKGLVYLTQFNIEPAIINNEGLTFVFQGITDDNKYLILATFPVKTKLLPVGFDAEEFEDYKLPQFFYEPKNLKQNEVNYKNYILKTENILNGLDSDQFNPDLAFLEELLTSLEVK